MSDVVQKKYFFANIFPKLCKYFPQQSHLALAVVAASGVDALCAGEVALRVGTLVYVHALGQVDELLVLAAGDDVGPDQPEALVAPDGGAVLVVVGLVLGLDEAVLDVGELEAALPRAVGHGAGPGAVTLAQQGRQPGPLVTSLALEPDTVVMVTV